MSNPSKIQLDQIQIASPCSVEWNSMSGDERKRFCQHCKLNVYNIAEMTEQEASDLIAHSTGTVCLRLYRRHDGTVITRDCPLGVAAIRRRIRRMWTTTMALAGMLFTGITLAAVTKRESSARWQQPVTKIKDMSVRDVVMGSACPVPVTAPPTPLPAAAPPTPLQPADQEGATP